MSVEQAAGRDKGGKGREAFRTISEVAEYLDLPQHVLRFWESKFSQIQPLKRGGNRRYYRPDDVALITAIKQLLHNDGYTIRGVQKLFKTQGIKATIALSMGEAEPVTVASVLGAEDIVKNIPSDNAPVGQGVDLASISSRLKKLRNSLS